jgi:hypothetical protein
VFPAINPRYPPRVHNRVSWSSWSWHLLNTQNVGSSILPEITFCILPLLQSRFSDVFLCAAQPPLIWVVGKGRWTFYGIKDAVHMLSLRYFVRTISMAILTGSQIFRSFYPPISLLESLTIAKVQIATGICEVWGVPKKK